MRRSYRRLLNRLSAVTEVSDFRYLVVPHTHWDREWYLPFEQFRLRLGAVVDGVLETLERDPSFTSFTLDGQPLVLVAGGCGEKIGLPNYSNVDINPITVSKFVEAGKELEGLRECYEIVETILAEERAKVLAMVQGS